MNKELEIRNYQYEVRFEENDRTIEGYAIVCNSESEDLGFREVIAPEALVGIIEKSDCLMLLEHDRKKGILARSKYGKGSLSLEVDDNGLKFRFTCPNTAIGDEAYEGVKRGDYQNCSFAFVADQDEWTKKDNGEYLRTIRSFKYIKDCSIVAEPAYGATSVSCRSFDEFKAEEERQANEAKILEAEKIEAEQREELKNYFAELRKNIG
jgi:HK97 family phage prohead protease